MKTRKCRTKRGIIRGIIRRTIRRIKSGGGRLAHLATPKQREQARIRKKLRKAHIEYLNY